MEVESDARHLAPGCTFAVRCAPGGNEVKRPDVGLFCNQPWFTYGETSLKLRVNVNGKDYEVEVEVLDAGPAPGLAEYGVPRPAVSTRSAAPAVAEKAANTRLILG